MTNYRHNTNSNEIQGQNYSRKMICRMILHYEKTVPSNIDSCLASKYHTEELEYWQKILNEYDFGHSGEK